MAETPHQTRFATSSNEVVEQEGSGFAQEARCQYAKHLNFCNVVLAMAVGSRDGKRPDLPHFAKSDFDRPTAEDGLEGLDDVVEYALARQSTQVQPLRAYVRSMTLKVPEGEMPAHANALQIASRYFHPIAVRGIRIA